MNKIRLKAFETNSSSCHSITLGKNEFFIADKLFPDDDGYLRIYDNKFGWGPEIFTDPAVKASYCVTYLQYASADEKSTLEIELKKTISEICQISVDKIKFIVDDGYIDHQSIDIGRNAINQARQFIFDPQARLIIDHDQHSPEEIPEVYLYKEKENEATQIGSYFNGSWFVEIFDDGTKTRSLGDDKTDYVEFPESVDLKITDNCDAGCPYCHETSTRQGVHADIKTIERLIKDLPPDVEIALGGGNPLAHPEIESILEILKNNRLITNMTVNEFHLEDPENHAKIAKWRAKRWIYGLGISLSRKYNYDIIKPLINDNTIFHVIAGIHSLEEIDSIPIKSKILILGYKTYGLGHKFSLINDDVHNKIGRLKYFLSLLNGRHLCFDTLAIQQLNVKNRLPEKTWNERFLGEDGTLSMYIDAVTDTWAISSSLDRKPNDQKNIMKLFSDINRTSNVTIKK